MEDLGAFIIAILVIMRVLSGVLGRGQQPRPPGRTGGGPRAGQQPPVRRVPEADEEPQTAATVSAADMIPDELWEILTGERRRPAPVSTPQSPVPVPVEAERIEWSPDPEVADRDEEEWDEEEWAPELPPSRAPRPAVSLEVEPVIRSLEALELPEEERHAAFHAKIAAPPMPAPPRRRRPVRLYLRDRDEMRRMMILREVLGPPKALE